MANSDLRLVDVPVVNMSAKPAGGEDPVERIIVDPDLGPMAFFLGSRMRPFKSCMPIPQSNTYTIGPTRVGYTDKGGGKAMADYHAWANKTSTQKKLDLLTVAKKNKLYRDMKGDNFCFKQECDYFVRKLQAKAVAQGGGMKIGDTAEFEIPEGPHTGSRILCRVFDLGTEQGTYHVRVPSQPPIVEGQQEFYNIPEHMLTKLAVTIWRCTYKMGMDIHESAESDGPIKNNVLRTRESLKTGEVVRVAGEQVGSDGITYLRLEDGRGWIYDQKPGVGVACVRDEAAGETASGIEVVVPAGDDGVTDLDVLAARLRKADAPAMIIGLRKVKPEQRVRMMNNLPEEKHFMLRDHLLADLQIYPMEEYLLMKELYKVAEVKKLEHGEGFGAGGG